ncbi:hypothetical protein JF711_03235 [Mycobacterium intracellulare]|nr:hypothetical protein [Mycobacterium intracellulare]
MREIAFGHPRWGWRKAHAITKSEGLVINPRRTHRLWKTNGCNVRRRPASGCAWATVRSHGAWRRSARSRLGAGLPARPHRRRPCAALLQRHR